MNAQNRKFRLENDCLDRGQYALTLCKIIADYVPKKPVAETGEFVELGEINSNPIKHMPDKEEPIREKESLPEDRPDARPPRQAEDRDYTVKINHLDNAAFIMAVSGAWGSGKTTFVKMLEDLLQGKGIEGIDDIDAIDEKDLDDDLKLVRASRFRKDEIAYFDAWKNDFYADPMLPFAELMLDTVCTKKTRNEAKQAIAGYLEAREEPARDHFSASAPGMPLKDRIDGIKRLLRQAVGEKSQKKAVVIIDELDRCRPTFAVRLLEIVKHLFNVKGIVFIFALDISQLQHCVKTVYGDGFDAIGYLERFFDYYSLLPRAPDDRLYNSFAKEYGLPENTAEKPSGFYRMCRQFNLTPREVKGVCSQFYYLNRYHLKDYPEKARLLYFYLLMLKIRHPEKVERLCSSGMEKKREKFFRKNMPECLKAENYADDEQPFYRAVAENQLIDADRYTYLDESGKTDPSRKEKTLGEGDKGSLSFVLYAPDFRENLKGRTILEYLFNRIESYGSSISMEIKKENIRRGSLVLFGTYRQDGEGKEKKPIEWIVLERKGDELLLISRYALDCRQYNKNYEKVTWKECTLRGWLNGGFLETAFTEEEKKRIVKTHVAAERNPYFPEVEAGEDTDDSVFLLSLQEAERYFASDEERQCEATGYALEGIRRVYEKKGWNGFEEDYGKDHRCWWWLRSPGGRSENASDVSRIGSFCSSNVHCVDCIVRPACRVNLES